MNDYGVNDVDDNYEDNGDDKYKGNNHKRPSLRGGGDSMTLVAIKSTLRMINGRTNFYLGDF